MNCPKCHCSKSVKSGKIKDRQRYKCKKCGCNYTVEIKSTAKPKSQKKQALHLYLEGLGFRSIGRVLAVIHPNIQKPVRYVLLLIDMEKIHLFRYWQQM